MNAKRSLVVVSVAAISLAGSMFTAGTAAAGKPARGCPASYAQVATLNDMVAIQVSYGNTGATAAALAPIDKNADGSLCWKVLPQGANDPYVPVNILDNTSNSNKS
jgi:hypothetical protein